MIENKQARKERPMARGVLDYFPDALAEVAHVSFIGNQQHNPGEEMHWERRKSPDHADCILRHLADRGKVDSDGLLHSAKVAWRALALLQVEIEEGRREADFEADHCGVVEQECTTVDPHKGESAPASRGLIYLAGPMRGYKDWNRPNFDRVAKILRARGYQVFSPIEADLKSGVNPGGEATEFFMRAVTKRDMEALVYADAIYLMRGWENSKGCRAEKAVADSIGIPVMMETAEVE